MTGCLTCRQRKVKCDGRVELCARCEKLGITCVWRETGDRFTPRSDSQRSVTESRDHGDLTQAGTKRFRISAACQACRVRKLKCDAGKPACSTCARKNVTCTYDAVGRRRRRGSGGGSMGDTASPTIADAHGSSVIDTGSTENGDAATTIREGSQKGSETQREARAMDITSPRSERRSEVSHDENRVRRNGTPETGTRPLAREPSRIQQQTPLEIPFGQALLPYIDSFLENAHPICCNNFLHPGVLCEALEKAPQLLVLVICGVSAKFLNDPAARSRGERWIAEAKDLILWKLDEVSTLTVTALQFLIMHELHEARFEAAWNLVGIATRMSLQLRLNKPAPEMGLETKKGTFLQQEIQQRLMWAVFVSDLLWDISGTQVTEAHLSDLPLPCNLWNFTQGMPCTTLRLHQLSEKARNDAVKQNTNPCAYLIAILVVRRKILRFVDRPQNYDGGSPWLDGSYFQRLCNELETWRLNLPKTFTFEERHMYTFRSSRHLDIFLMIHAWYHQAGCELFGAWMAGHPGTLKGNMHLQAPQEFRDACTDRCISHARSITLLIQKVLKVEPQHLFRDSWFSICILESTQIQLATMQRRTMDEEQKDEHSALLKLNLRALRNTKRTIPLAEKIYQECCAAIRRAGFEQLIGLEESSSIDISPRAPPSKPTLDIFHRYPFLQPPPVTDTDSWTHLFSGTYPSGPGSPTRSPSPSPSTPSHIPLHMRLQLDSSQLSGGMLDMSYLDVTPDQFLYPWPSNDFNWQQQPDMDQTAAAALVGLNQQMGDGSGGVNGGLGTAQGMMDLGFFANTMAQPPMGGSDGFQQGFGDRQ